jgi:hypothetical protein
MDYEDIDSNRIIPGEWRSETSVNFTPIVQQGSNRYSVDAKSVRDEFMHYFNTSGQVEWQESGILLEHSSLKKNPNWKNPEKWSGN